MAHLATPAHIQVILSFRVQPSQNPSIDQGSQPLRRAIYLVAVHPFSIPDNTATLTKTAPKFVMLDVSFSYGGMHATHSFVRPFSTGISAQNIFIQIRVASFKIRADSVKHSVSPCIDHHQRSTKVLKCRGTTLI
jgi:hypothetical protein